MCRFQGYKLHYTHDMELPLNLWNIVDTNSTSVTLNDLSPNQNIYYVTIKAYTRIGYGELAKPVVVDMNEESKL